LADSLPSELPALPLSLLPLPGHAGSRAATAYVGDACYSTNYVARVEKVGREGEELALGKEGDTAVSRRKYEEVGGVGGDRDSCGSFTLNMPQ